MAVHLSLIDFAPDGSGTIITTTSSLQPRPRVTQVADVLAAESQPGPARHGLGERQCREVVRAHRASGPALDEHDPVETAQEALEQLEALLRSRS